MGELRVLSVEGDTKTVWDPANQEEVEVAEETFNRLKKKGYTAYKVGRTGKKTTIMETFDPKAGKLIMAPRVAGG